jgi:hypothetical protein
MSVFCLLFFRHNIIMNENLDYRLCHFQLLFQVIKTLSFRRKLLKLKFTLSKISSLGFS